MFDDFIGSSVSAKPTAGRDAEIKLARLQAGRAWKCTRIGDRTNAIRCLDREKDAIAHGRFSHCRECSFPALIRSREYDKLVKEGEDMGSRGTCAHCGREMVIAARGMCGGCYTKSRRGTLGEKPPATVKESLTVQPEPVSGSEDHLETGLKMVEPAASATPILDAIDSGPWPGLLADLAAEAEEAPTPRIEDSWSSTRISPQDAPTPPPAAPSPAVAPADAASATPDGILCADGFEFDLTPPENDFDPGTPTVFLDKSGNAAFNQAATVAFGLKAFSFIRMLPSKDLQALGFLFSKERLPGCYALHLDKVSVKRVKCRYGKLVEIMPGLKGKKLLIEATDRPDFLVARV